MSFTSPLHHHARQQSASVVWRTGSTSHSFSPPCRGLTQARHCRQSRGRRHADQSHRRNSPAAPTLANVGRSSHGALRSLAIALQTGVRYLQDRFEESLHSATHRATSHRVSRRSAPSHITSAAVYRASSAHQDRFWFSFPLVYFLSCPRGLPGCFDSHTICLCRRHITLHLRIASARRLPTRELPSEKAQKAVRLPPRHNQQPPG
jgi:hypothetical protein